MKNTLASLLDPRFDFYRSLGELARTLQFLLSTSVEYRDAGRWGSCGPTEELNDHSGCTNSADTYWSTCRQWHDDLVVPSWQHHHDRIYKCLLAALCSPTPASVKWRTDQAVSLDTVLKFPMAYQRATEEQDAWKAFVGLHLRVLPVASLNPQHRNIKLLVFPKLVISGRGVFIRVEVTDKTEWRQSKGCCSRWDVAWITDVDAPKWNPQRETFAVFILRAVKFYHGIQPRTGPRR